MGNNMIVSICNNTKDMLHKSPKRRLTRGSRPWTPWWNWHTSPYADDETRYCFQSSQSLGGAFPCGKFIDEPAALWEDCFYWCLGLDIPWYRRLAGLRCSSSFKAAWQISSPLCPLTFLLFLNKADEFFLIRYSYSSCLKFLCVPAPQQPPALLCS